ncbi:MAG: alpha/beta hydrolase family protein [Candidatus Aminicenantes bacterium]|nr:alpha/beta hydrolase family protein [Candidatus Aminicenantes bacterium]
MKNSKASRLALAAAIVLGLAVGQPLLSWGGPASGQVLEGLRFNSRVLGRDVPYAIYLPPDYATSSRRYPVVYLLHGFSDDESGWIQFGEVNMAADKAISDREIPPMIIVMPDGGVSWYINDSQNKVRYEDMFVQELIPHIDRTFRTRPSREFRGISGLSMGGWGTLVYALRHPELFAACAAFSAGIWPDEEILGMKQDTWDEDLGPVFGAGLSGKDRLTPYFRQVNPLDLAKSLPVESLKKVRFYIDCGDDDFLIKGNCALHFVLTDRKIPHEFRVRDGAHTWIYWRTGIVEGLAFIGRSFER